MSVALSAPSPDRKPMTHAPTPILAVVYSDSRRGADALRRLVSELRTQGAACTGFVECEVAPLPGQSRCDMVIEFLSNGQRLKISEDRGPLARGCRLDGCVLAEAHSWALDALGADPDVLVVNKFGKSEAEGGGFRPVIAEAIGRGIPVLIAVPWRNIESWRLFAGALSREIDVEGVSPGIEAEVIADLRRPDRQNGRDLPKTELGLAEVAGPVDDVRLPDGWTGGSK